MTDQLSPTIDPTCNLTYPFVVISRWNTIERLKKAKTNTLFLEFRNLFLFCYHFHVCLDLGNVPLISNNWFTIVTLLKWAVTAMLITGTFSGDFFKYNRLLRGLIQREILFIFNGFYFVFRVRFWTFFANEKQRLHARQIWNYDRELLNI